MNTVENNTESKKKKFDRGRMQQAIEAWEDAANKQNQQAAHEDKIKTGSSENTDMPIHNSPEKKDDLSDPTGVFKVTYYDPQSKPPVDDDKTILMDKTVLLKKSEPPVIEEDKEDPYDIQAERLDKRFFSLVTRFIFCLFGTSLLVWLSSAAACSLPLPRFFSLNTSVLHYVLVNTLILLVIGLLSIKSVLSGVKSLLLFKSSSDSLVFVSFLGALANCVYLLAQSGQVKNGNMLLYSAAAGALMTFDLLAKLMDVSRARKNLRLIMGEENIISVQTSQTNEDTDHSQEDEPKTASTAYTVKANHFSDYIGQSFAQTPADRLARIMSPTLLVIALVLLAACFVLGRGAYNAVASFAAVCSIGAPLLFNLGAALPLFRTGKKLRKRKAVLCGYNSVLDFCNTEVLLADAGMIFPPDMVAIHGIKTFSGHKIEEAIVDAASVVCTVSAPLSDAFLNLIEGEEQQVLKKAQHVYFKDDLGLTGIIDGKTVLVGNRELLRRGGVQIPPREYEAKYIAEGREIVYLAAGKELCAMFIVGYYPTKEITSTLRKIERLGIKLLVKTNDANITPSMISDRLNMECSNVEIISSRESDKIKSKAFGDSVPAGLAFTGNIRAYASALVACIRLKSTIGSCMVMQIIGAVLGIGIVAYFSLTSGIKAFTPFSMLEYQGIWMIPTLIISGFRKNC